MTGVGRRFYATALAVGATFANLAVAVPLQVHATGGAPGLVGVLIAGATVAIGAGALLAGAVASRIGGGPRTLAVALAACGAGSALFVATHATAVIAVSGLLIGSGIGLFWVSSQLVLGRRSGEPGSESAFLVHYAVYTAGAVVGSVLTGVTVGLAERAGLSATTGLQLSGLVGVGAAAAAFVAWWPRAARAEYIVYASHAWRSPSRYLTMQIPDLLIVSALAVLLPLAPTVLANGYHLGPFAIGVVMSGVSLAKIGGTFTARRLTRSRGARRSIVLQLAAGGASCLLLCVAFGVSFFVVVLLATTLFVTGTWPLIVDSAQARVDPESRAGLTVVWNAREYVAIAAGTFLAGWLLELVGRPEPLFALAAVLIAIAALCSGVILRRPALPPPA